MNGSGRKRRELRDQEKSADTANSDAPVLEAFPDTIASACFNARADKDPPENKPCGCPPGCELGSERGQQHLGTGLVVIYRAR